MTELRSITICQENLDAFALPGGQARISETGKIPFLATIIREKSSLNPFS